jgi:hypothetical protein
VLTHCVYLSVIHDVNKRVHAENALRKSECRNQEFASDVTHKLWTSLAVLQTQLGNMDETEREAAACRTCRRYIPTACGDELGETISDP